MKLRNETLWKKGLKNNQDPYGAATYQYAVTWADLMEAHMAAGEELKDVAKSTSHEADIEGITGFMYGCAVQILAEVWQYGEELRRWHNLATQMGDEGEKANASGGTLNPALVVIGGPKVTNDQ
jgi:hypothetical protein